MFAMVVALQLASVAVVPEPFGAYSPSPAPAGTVAMYAAGGFPDLRAGYRQGLKSFDLGAEAGVDYLRASTWLQGGLRARLVEGAPWTAALGLHVGGFANGGATYYDSRNQASAGLRLEAGASLTYRTLWPVSFFAQARIPVEVPLTRRGATRLEALVGGGAEIAVAQDWYVLFSGAFGPDMRWRSGTKTQTLLGVEAIAGVGYRLF